MSATTETQLKRKSPDDAEDGPPTQRPYETASTTSAAVASIYAQQNAFATYGNPVLPTAPNQTVPPPHMNTGPSSEDGLSSEATESPNKGGRPLSTSKRAEQNRKAQRAFRERRDQRVKQLEHKASMLDDALKEVNEAHMRCDEFRTMLDDKSQQLAQTEASLNASRSYIQQLKSLLAQNNISIPSGPDS
ncbi:hypothetical protein DL96DRAFT_1168294 [Flagelloscypha sp. PMI_526]|nr:hypothetical protein DL96DRAFT_1168294 [Flagelloscypha sp. PMI_526]